MGIAKKIGQHFLWRGLYLISVFVINLLMARILGAGESGRFFLLINNLALIIMVVGFCLESSFVFYGASGKISFNKLASLGLLWSVSTPIITILFLWFGWPQQFDTPDILFIAGYVFSFMLINIFTGLFHADQNFATASQVLTLVNIVFIIYFFRYANFSHNPTSEHEEFTALIQERIKSAFYYTVFLQGFLLFAISRKKLKIKQWILPTTAEILLLLRYSAQSFFSNIVFFLISRSGYWFIEYYGTDSSLGNFIQVSKLGQIFVLPSIIIAGSLFPQTAGDKINFQSKSFSILLRFLFGFYFSGILLSALIGNTVISFLWGNEYAEMYDTWLWYIPGVLFLAISYLFSPIMAGKGKVIYNILIGLIALTVVIVCSFFMIPVWGIRGAAIASSTGFMVMMILYFIIAKRKFGFSFLNKQPS